MPHNAAPGQAVIPVNSLPESGSHGVLRQISAWLPVLICVAVISVESTRYFGADHTTGPLRHLLEMLFGRFSDARWDGLHLMIRKSGHFTGYGILSLAFFRAFWMTWRLHLKPRLRRLPVHGLAMLGTLLVASADEFHQTFLPNRTGTPVDVLVDCSGALILQAILWLWMQKRFAN